MRGKFMRCAGIVLALALLIPGFMFPASSAGAAPGALVLDGTQDVWAEPELREANEFGLTYPAIMGNYKAAITREEFCTIVVKLYEALTGEAAAPVSPNPFTDTSNPEILKANNLRIVFGTAADRFTPHDNITRQEICVMIFRALEVAIPGLDRSESAAFSFSDADQIANWAYSAMRFCNKNEIMLGTSTTTISPLDNTTREQAIALLKRTFVAYAGDGEGEGEIDDKDEEEEGADSERRRTIEQAAMADMADLVAIDKSKLLLGDAVLTDTGRFSDFVAIDTGKIQRIIDRGSLGLPESEYQMGHGNMTDPDSKGINFLGRGYNVLGNFASPDTKTSLKLPVLDVEKMLKYRQVDEITSFNMVDFFNNISRSAYEYCNKTTTHVGVSGGYMGFSASVDTNFGSETKTQSSKYLSTISYWIRLHEYQLVSPLSFDWAAYVYPTVLKELNDSSVGAAEILDTYGSHILTSVRIGGRMDYNVSVDSQYNESFSSFEISVKGSFNAGFAKFGMDIGHDSSTFSSTFAEKTERTVKCYGGILDTGNLLNPDYAADKMHEWRLSLEGPDGTPTFCDFGGQALKPIWELCSSKARSDAIEAEFKKRVLAQPDYPMPGFVTDFHTTGSNLSPDRYFRAGPNMNEWGNDVYLHYFIGEVENNAYTDIFATYYPRVDDLRRADPPSHIFSTSPENPWYVTHRGNYAGFWRRSGDINYGSRDKWKGGGVLGIGGKNHNWFPGEIYLFGTTAKTKDPIKKIEVLRDPNLFILTTTPSDWEFVTLLNETAPFNFNQGVYDHGDRPPAIYVRFMRG